MDFIKVDFLTTINLVGIGIGFFLTLIILSQKKWRRAVRILLSLFVFVISVLTFMILLNMKEYYEIYPHLMKTMTPFYLAAGPCLFLYVKSMTKANFSFKKQYLLHFLPFFIQIIYNTPYYLLDAETKIQQFRNYIEYHDFVYEMNLLIKILHLFFYFVLITRLLRLHRKKIKDYYSSIDKIKLNWIRYLILLLGFNTIILSFAFTMFSVYRNESFDEAFSMALCLLNPMLIIFVGYKGLTQSVIFPGDDKANTEKESRRPLLSQDKIEIYKDRLLEVMKNEKPYLDSELTLVKLADVSSIPPRHLSQLLNENLHQNFFDFVNQYRIEEAKNLLVQPEFRYYSILGIAFESGFNSKSSFNSIFKKVTDMTPTQFKESCSDD